MNTTANKITMFRIVLIPVFLVFAYTGLKYWALAVYIIACLSDVADGYIARHYNQVSNFGKFVDPLADKMLTTAAIIYMVVDGVCSPVVLAIIMFREFAVAGVRMIAAESGTVIAANMWGKVKTVLQMVTIIFYYFAMALAPADGVGVISFTTQVLCWAVAAVTALSGCIYLWQNRSCFMQAK
jgi:CDP-diacylglycerol--glycerol-3-phosphate 3-phosphatidyltransferase